LGNLDIDVYQAKDYELWNIIIKGPYVQITTVDGKVVKKTEDRYTQEDKTTWTNYYDLKGCPLTGKILDIILLRKRKHTKTSL